MKNLFLISCLSLLLASCSTTKTISQSDIEKPIADNIECSKSSMKKVNIPLTNGKEVLSNRQYCYVWELQKQDRSIILFKTGISSNTKYVSWPENTVISITNGNKKHDTLANTNLYKFTNEKNFSIESEKIKVRASFYLEQNDEDIYLSLINNYVFKDITVPNNPEIDLVNRVNLKIGETIVIKVPTPYIDDNNKFYNLKFTINAFD